MQKKTTLNFGTVQMHWCGGAVIFQASALPTDSPLLSLVVSTCIICNFERNKKSLNSTVSGSVKLQVSLSSTGQLFTPNSCIVQGCSNQLHSEFHLFHTSCRFEAHKCRTKRYRHLFVPAAIQLLLKPASEDALHPWITLKGPNYDLLSSTSPLLLSLSHTQTHVYIYMIHMTSP